MKIAVFWVLLLLTGVPFLSYTQLMNNGGFEVQDGSVPSGTLQPDISIENAAYWHNLTGSCDLIPLVSGTAHTGVGAGILGVGADGWTEFCYGSTQPLIAGHTYQVSFWIRKDYEPTNGTDLTYGLSISTDLPVITTSPLTSSVPPLMMIKVESTQWVKAQACFVAGNSVSHYVAIGPFGGNGTTESVVCRIDDVEVLDVTNLPLPTAAIDVPQPVYCVGDPVILDGSTSSNEDSYEWKILLNGIQEVYSSGVLSGEAGAFDASNHLGFLQPGSCYTAQLTVFGICTDVATADFCFANPSIDFIYDGSSVCEQVPVDLQVTGDNGWTYTWSDASGQLASGAGLKQLTVTPTVGNATYTVTVTTLEGCTSTKSITLNVSEQNNLPPWMDGINGWGEYTIYVQQGQTVSFTSTLYNDHSNEVLTITTTNTIPSSFTANLPTDWEESLNFHWNTNNSTPTGEYHYILTANDRNACQPGVGVFDFRIIVVCDQCPVCLAYENRLPGNDPLPPLTKVGKCIEAGMTDTVSTGDAAVIFRAGKSIEEGPHFYAGPGYEAYIDTTTCIADCEDCCVNWSGFTYDPLPNPFYMNFSDNDPTNDFIQVTDSHHPFCAFNAMAFDFYIENNWGNHVNDVWPTSQWATSCCEFRSPAPENPIAHSPIWWDGQTTNLFGNHVRVSDGVYFYTLTLYGCNGQMQEFQGYIEVFGAQGMVLAGSTTGQAHEDSRLTVADQVFVTQANAQREALEQAVSIHPNPASAFIEIRGADPVNSFYQLFDAKGLLLSKKEKILQSKVDISKLASGTYYIWIYSGDTYVSRKFVKI